MKFIDVKKEVEAAASESRLNPDFTALHSSHKQQKEQTSSQTLT